MFTVLLQFLLEYGGCDFRKYKIVDYVERTHNEWTWVPVYPQYSETVLSHQEHFASIGIYTPAYLDWKAYYVDLYYYQKILGSLFYPWYMEFVTKHKVLVDAQHHWYEAPLMVFVLWFIVFFSYMFLRKCLGFRQRYADIKARATSDPHFQKEIYERARRVSTEYNEYIPTAVGLVGAIVTGLVIWNQMRDKAPAPEFGITRDSNTFSWDAYLPSFSRKTAQPQSPRNMASEELQNVIKKHITNVEADGPNSVRKIKGIYIDAGILMLPLHFFRIDPCKEELLDKLDLRLETGGQRTRVTVYEKSLYRISGKDCVLIQVPKAPKMKVSLSGYLPKKTGDGSHRSVLLYKESDKDFQTEVVSAKYASDIDCGGHSCGRGVSYESKISKVGFCGSPIIADKRDGAIIAFHISGLQHGSIKYGYAQEILYSDYQEAHGRLKTSPSYIKTPHCADLPLERYGLPFIKGPGPHPKTRIFDEGELESFNGIEVLGHDLDLVKYKTKVHKSVISDLLEKHTGVKNHWKPAPLQCPWAIHNEALKHVAQGAREIPPESLRWAVDDYKSGLMKVFT
jgi:hypothetical protein